MKVFPIGNDAAHNGSSPENQGWPQIQDTSQFADVSTTSLSNVGHENLGNHDEVEWRDEVLADTTGNGLYWFWDSMWGEPQI